MRVFQFLPKDDHLMKEHTSAAFVDKPWIMVVPHRFSITLKRWLLPPPSHEFDHL